MWFEAPLEPSQWKDAERHLCGVDPRLAAIIGRVGPCTLAPRRDYFVVLCKAIFTQQISTAVAAVLFGRFRDLFPSRRPTPERVLEAFNRDRERVMKHCGLSRQKAVYLQDLAEHFAAGKIPTRRISRMSDEEIIQSLIDVKGVGRWTAEMFLIFVLNRPDVLPVGDLGLREGAREVFNLKERPTGKSLKELAEPWAPWRSIATWYLWRRGAMPEKKTPVKKTPQKR